MVLTKELDDRSTQADPRIQKLIQQTVNLRDASPAISTIVTEILKLLHEVGMCSFNVRLPIAWVGVHKANRYGLGINIRKCHKLGAKIWKIGFNWNACQMVICIEDDDKKSNADFTTKMQGTNKSFAKQSFERIKYASLGGGHLNQLLNCIKMIVQCEHPEISCEGRMSLEQIAARSADFADAVNNGLYWTVITKEAAKLYPELPNLIQRERNAIAQTHNAEGIIEMMNEVQQLVRPFLERGDAPNWSEIQSIVLQSESPNKEDVPHVCAFVQKYGGGVKGQFVEEISDFTRVVVPADREVEGSYLNAFCKLKLAQEELSPDFVVACVLAQATCPDDKVKNGVCKFIKDGAIARFDKDPKLKTSMIECNKLLHGFKQWVNNIESHRLSPEDKIALNGQCSCVIARKILGESIPAKYAQCENANNVAFYVAGEVCDAANNGRDKIIENPYAALEPKADEDTKAPNSIVAPSKRMAVEYDDGGNALGMNKLFLTEKGFSTEQVVTIIEGKEDAGATFVIKSIEDNGDVKLRQKSEDIIERQIRRVPFDIFLDKYKIQIDDNRTCIDRAKDISNSSIFKIREHEGVLTSLMCQAYKSFKMPNLDITDHPSKGVFAKEHFDKKTLFLPIFGRICAFAKDDSVMHGHYEMKSAAVTGYKFFIKVHPANEDEVSACSFIKYTQKADDVNAIIEYKPIGFFTGAKVNKSMVQIPVVVNSSVLEKDDELVLHKPAIVIERRLDVEIDCGLIAKNPKL